MAKLSILAETQNPSKIKNIKEARETKETKEIKKLLDIYHQEPLLHQRILQIKALLYHMSNKGDFLRGLSASNLRAEDGKKFNIYNLNPILERLIHKKLLSHDNNCHPLILQEMTKIAVSQKNPAVSSNLAMLKHFFDYRAEYKYASYHVSSNTRTIHVAVHSNNQLFFLNSELMNPEFCRAFMRDLRDLFFNCSLDWEWVTSRHPIIQLYLLCIKLCAAYDYTYVWPLDSAQWIDFIRQQDCLEIAMRHQLDKIPLMISRILQLSLWFKKLSYLEALPHLAEKQHYQEELRGMLAFFHGNKELAISKYEQAKKLFNAYPSIEDRKQNWVIDNTQAILYVLALLSQTTLPDQFKKIDLIITALKKFPGQKALAYILEVFVCLKQNNRNAAMVHYNDAYDRIKESRQVSMSLEMLMSWVFVLLDIDNLSKRIEVYKHYFQSYRDTFYYLPAQIYAELIQLHDPENKEVIIFLNDVKPFGDFRFLSVISIKQPWEYAFEQLQALVAPQALSGSNSSSFIKEKRLAWIIDPKTLQIEAVEQTLRKTGGWNAGRPIALRRLYQNDDKLDYLTQEDIAAIKGLETQIYGWYNHENYYWDKQETLKALIGHPRVFHAQNRDIPIELVPGTIELQIEPMENGYHFSLSKHSAAPTIFLDCETPNRYRVIDFPEEAVSISTILTEKGMTVPASARERVINMICQAKSSIHIQSNLTDDELPIVSGDLTPHVHLLPMQEGLRITLWLRPFGDQGPYSRPAEGQRHLIATLVEDSETNKSEVRKKVVRDFEAEKQSTQTVLDQCPTLAEFDEKTQEWQFTNIENCLELLLELDDYQQNHPIVLEWPKGQTLKVKQTVSSKNLSLSIKGGDYWFEYEGEVQIDSEQTMDIKKLLDLLTHSQGRFVKLASGEFIALTENFKRQLENLKSLSDGNRVYHLGAGNLQELAAEAGSLQEDQAWMDHLKKITAMKKYKPVIPSTLQAELREYQVEGFQYLARLSHWEIGACLADDMGLGKTVQAITLLLTQAKLGPCLVIAPTSVCFVWLEELAKFAPTLNPYTLYNTNDRSTTINEMGKMDVLICSYGLLHQAGDLLLEKTWQMVILDEAQAIKNPETKRWKYATQLKSKRRIALTGTPIENHLGELWSIFRFLNPGLLGSLASFQQKFSTPIERFQDPVAKRVLKNLVSPYLLRRTKSEVLLELPPKIEQSILIEPSSEEIAFYEAVRVQALERIGHLETENSNNKRFSILAEITRLRQACCHASLVNEEMVIESSKVKIFLQLVKNMIDNKHKVLVFSQFVRYLAKIKEVLDQENIFYQSLDGTTPIKERQRAVEAFQAGEGDVFLISLKAGGTGLNLTAADYVIILDPWWNPAVEDQASDRAHRIGQVRPVTVYRLIMKNSIEEKIIALHKSKKDLAADLLSGSDMSGKLSEKELVALITG